MTLTDSTPEEIEALRKTFPLKCLALVDELLPTLTEKTTACLALLLVAGNVGGWTIVLGGWL